MVVIPERFRAQAGARLGYDRISGACIRLPMHCWYFQRMLSAGIVISVSPCVLVWSWIGELGFVGETAEVECALRVGYRLPSELALGNADSSGAGVTVLFACN